MLPRFDHIEITRRGRVLPLALNRPERLNAFNVQLHADLSRAIAFAAEAATCDVVILTGWGCAFSADGDIDWQRAATGQPQMFEATMRAAKQIVFGLTDCEKPIISRINGPPVGPGATIALL
jgi:enoyl-CoA hydratase